MCGCSYSIIIEIYFYEKRVLSSLDLSYLVKTIEKNGSGLLKRVCGFALFFIAVGVIIGNLIGGKWCDFAFVVFCFVAGYFLFFCC